MQLTNFSLYHYRDTLEIPRKITLETSVQQASIHAFMTSILRNQLIIHHLRAENSNK